VTGLDHDLGKRAGAERIMRTIGDLRPGDHLCHIYRDDEEHRTVLVEYLHHGLIVGERVMCIGDASTENEVRGRLLHGEGGIGESERRGQLVFLTRDKTLDPNAMISLLRRETQRALDDGCAGLRVAGEMAWALRELPRPEQLIESEALLNEFFPREACTGLCQYDARSYPAELLLDVLRTHPIVILGKELHSNIYYIPPAELFAGNMHRATLQRWIGNLEETESLLSSLRTHAGALQERVKELDCLRRVRELASRDDLPLADLLRATLDPIRSGWRWPKRVQVRIELEGERYETDGYRMSPAQLTAPLLGRGEPLGSIDISYPDPPPASEPFLPEERDLLEEIASRVSSAIEMRRSRERILHLNAALRAIRNVNRLIVRERDVAGLIQTACELLCETREFSVAWIALIDEDGALERWAGTGTPREMDALISPWRSGDPPVCVLRALNDDRPVIIERTDSACPRCPMVARCSEGAVLAVRLEHADRVRGVLVVGVHERYAADPAEQEILREVAGDIAFAITMIGIEEALREREERFRSLYENASLGLYRTTPDGRILMANPALVRMLGYETLEELAGRNLKTEGYEPDYPRERFLERIERNGEVRGLESAWRCKDGSALFIRESAHAVRDDLGRTICYDGTVEDITEHKEAEEALRESENRFRVLFEHNLAGVYVTAEDGRFVACNKAFSDLLGYDSPEEVMSLGAGALYFSPQNRSAFVAEILSAGVITSRECRLRRKDGQPVFLLENASVLPVGGGKAPMVLGTLVDVTRLRESELRFRELFRASPVPIQEEDFSAVKRDLDTLQAAGIDDLRGYLEAHPETVIGATKKIRILQANKAALRLYGVADTSEMEARLPDFMGGVQRIHVEELMAIVDRRAAFAGRCVNFDARGKRLHVQLRWTVSPGCEETYDRVFLSVLDETAQVDALLALTESEERFRRLAENAPDLIYRYRLSPEPGFDYVSPAAAVVTGYTPEEHYADPQLGLKLVHPEDRSILAAMMRGEAPPGEPLALRWVRKDGRVVWTEQRNVPVFDAEGKMVALEGIARDITSRRESQEALRESFSRLKRTLEQSIRVLASTVELRDPYTAGHQRRVAELSCAIGERMGLDADQIDGLRMAAAVHDVGKIQVPAELLTKPTELTALEYDIIKRHPLAGYELLKDVEFPWPVATAILQHHEMLDGSGYPQGLSGDAIILEARILGVADVVEAMASHRPYRPALGLDRALEEIARGRGVLYDSNVVDVCTHVLRTNEFSFA